MKVFEDVECFGEMFLAQLDLLKGQARDSEVFRAVRNATPEPGGLRGEVRSDRAAGARHLPAGGRRLVEVFELLEDGTVKRTYHEGGSEEAERIRQEARQRGPAS